MEAKRHRPVIKREKQPPSPIWTTKDGTKVRVCDMTDSHLVNTIAYFERIAQNDYSSALYAGYAALSMMQGEMAIMTIENELDTLGGDDWEDDMPGIYDDMLDEAKRRNLTLKTT